MNRREATDDGDAHAVLQIDELDFTVGVRGTRFRTQTYGRRPVHQGSRTGSAPASDEIWVEGGRETTG